MTLRSHLLQATLAICLGVVGSASRDPDGHALVLERHGAAQSCQP